jgi:cell division protein FtsI/penicillin-binding protein 2
MTVKTGIGEPHYPDHRPSEAYYGRTNFYRTNFVRFDFLKENAWRYSTLGILLTAVAIFIVVQMVRIYLSPQAKIIMNRGEAYIGQWQTIVPARGQIYDRWGHLLAGNVTVYEVGVDLAQVKNPTAIAMALSSVTGANYGDVYAAASKPYDPNSSVYAVLTDFVTEAQKKQLEQLAAEMENAYQDNPKGDAPSLAGLNFVPHLQRSYPEKDLASNILGFVNRQGQGFFGVEEYSNSLLAGTPRKVWVSWDPNQVQNTQQVPEGASLILTIDRAIQSEVEQILDRALKDSGSEAGTILVSDPTNGEILAMATTPRLDLNEYWRYGEVFQDPTPFNRAVSKSYEPGSVFKVLTMSAGLDTKAVTPDTSFLDTGTFEIGGVNIHNWGYTVWGPQTMLGCMQHSINVCLTWVATQLGANRFYNYMQRFSIGHLTGIDLGEEVPGHLKLPGDGDWYEADLATNSFGQGVSVTPVQMIMAVSALANDGKMVAPHVTRAIVEKGKQYDIPVQVVGMPISTETAHTITDLLATSLEIESSNALVDGYRIAGKTGTAEIPTPYGYTSNETNASFVGWGPVDNPRFLVYIWLERPKSSIWGSEVAAPVFQEVVQRLVVLMNIPPDDIRKGLNGN